MTVCTTLIPVRFSKGARSFAITSFSSVPNGACRLLQELAPAVRRRLRDAVASQRALAVITQLVHDYLLLSFRNRPAQTDEAMRRKAGRQSGTYMQRLQAYVPRHIAYNGGAAAATSPPGLPGARSPAAPAQAPSAAAYRSASANTSMPTKPGWITARWGTASGT